MSAEDHVRGKSVLFLHPSDEAYGADRVLLILVDGLIVHGWHITVILPDDVPPGWLSKELSRRGVSVVRGPLAVARRRYLRAAALPRYVRSLIKARTFVRATAMAQRPAIIHVNTTALLMACVLGRPAKARLYWHVHEIVGRPRFLSWAFRIAPVVSADAVIAVSDAVATWLAEAGVRRHRIVRIHNGIPPQVTSTSKQQTRVRVAYIGRLNRWKGYEVFVDAIAPIARRHPEAQFVVAGDPPLGEEWRDADLRRRIGAAGLDGRVQVLGFLTDVTTLLEAIDVVVVPSIWPDPFPTVILEAMRAGCAVIASDHGGAPEMIVQGVSGILVAPGDIGAFSTAVDTLITDGVLRRRLGENATRRVVAEFDASRFVDDVIRLYMRPVS